MWSDQKLMGRFYWVNKLNIVFLYSRWFLLSFLVIRWIWPCTCQRLLKRFLLTSCHEIIHSCIILCWLFAEDLIHGSLSSGNAFRIDFKGKVFFLKGDLMGLTFKTKGFSNQLTCFFAGFFSKTAWKDGACELDKVFFNTSSYSVLLFSQFLPNLDV